MKALIGVDVLGDSATAIDLFQRLQFKADEVVLLHSVESVMPDGSFPGVMSPGMMGDMLRESEEVGKKALRQADSHFNGSATQHLVIGDPFRSLVSYAEEHGTDLIVVFSHKKGAVEAFITGSVTRGLLTGSKTSFLAAKPGFRTEGKLKAIFATDHSDYSKRCADRLVQFAPQGIAELIVATAIDGKVQRDLLAANDSEFSGNENLWAEDRISRENQALCRKFAPLAENCSEVVLHGDANKALAQLMKKEQADLLIIGAQGHGFFERLTSGSVSFHQVVAEAYPVLVVRV